MNENNTSRRTPAPSDGPHGPGLVAFLFGLARRTALAGTDLRRLLGAAGVAPNASRALLARMVRAGQLRSERAGRTTTYALAGSFLAAWERVRRQAMTAPVTWTGEFHALLHTVPEEHRAFRDQLRRGAVLAGYGTLQPGVLISPTDRRHALAAVLDATPPGARVRAATLGLDVAAAADAAALAWDLPALARTYRDHVARLDADPGPGDLRAYVERYQPALSDTLREPALDPVLLPPDWPGAELRRAFARYEERHAAVVTSALGPLAPQAIDAP